MSGRMSRFHNALIGKLARLRDDVRGVSAVEFAILLPIMLLLFIGGNQWTEAITIKHKVTLVARTIGDLVTQAKPDPGTGIPTVSDAEMNGILDAGQAVVSPFATTTLQIIVSCVAIDAQGNAKIGWSQSRPVGADHTVNSTATLPWTASDVKNNMKMANTKLIWAETSYVYTPPVAFTMWSSTNTGAITLTDHSYFRPRTGTTIARVSGPVC
jgi:Flp pilus assembly protein TadG